MHDGIKVSDCDFCCHQVSMGWEVDESALALKKAGGDVLAAAEALAEKEEADLER